MVITREPTLIGNLKELLACHLDPDEAGKREAIAMAFKEQRETAFLVHVGSRKVFIDHQELLTRFLSVSLEAQEAFIDDILDQMARNEVESVLVKVSWSETEQANISVRLEEDGIRLELFF